MVKRWLPFLLLIGAINVLNAQSPLNDSTFFTPASFYDSLGLKRTESNKLLKVYTKRMDEIPGDIERAVDIRWVFASKQEALDYLEKNLGQQSEGGYKIKKEILLPNADKVYVYREDPTAVGMYEMLGTSYVHWYYIFVIDRVVAKVFTSGNNTSMAASYAIALAAARHISTKLSLPVNQSAVSLFTGELEKGFRDKIASGKLRFYGLAGFEPQPLPAGLSKYFDQELGFPAEKFIVRYFVIDNPELKKFNLEDSVDYKKYCQQVKMASLSVSLNVMMEEPGKMPAYNEINDRNKCTRINNSDYIIEYLFETGKRTELAKGYKYCYMYATYKQGLPDCYVVFLSDHKEHFTLFPQVYKASIRYPR